MILNRFCSLKEYEKFKRGEEVYNYTNHREEGRGSSSVGFCFFSGKVLTWARRLNGIADFDVLITVSTSPEDVIQSEAYYYDRSKDKGDTFILPRMKVREYCTTHYSRAKFILIAADFSFRRKYVSKKNIGHIYDKLNLIKQYYDL